MISHSDVKQVIVMRKDLKMRKGKMVAQGCHASIGAVDLTLLYGHRDIWNQWCHDGTTKICVSVDSGSELLRIAAAARDANLPVYVVTDAGHTEFHGVPTITCLAIGPFWSEDIDKITEELKLL